MKKRSWFKKQKKQAQQPQNIQTLNLASGLLTQVQVPVYEIDQSKITTDDDISKLTSLLFSLIKLEGDEIVEKFGISHLVKKVGERSALVEVMPPQGAGEHNEQEK